MDSYDNRKPSDIEWIGDIPQHWYPKKLKYLGDVLGGSTPDTGNRDYWNGDIIWVTPSDISKIAGNYIYDSQRKITQEGLENSGASLVETESIIITTRAPIGNMVLAGLRLCTNQGCKSLTVRNGSPLFYYYQLVSFRGPLEALGVGTTFNELSTDALKGFLLLSPPEEEQTAIARYLDGKSTEINELVANKRLLIELLNEERTAIINQAVTKGINANTNYHPSGFDWLGDIPEDWQVKKLKYISPKVMVGLVINPSTYFDPLGTVPMLTGRNVTPNNINVKSANVITQESNEALHKTRLADGDIVVVRVGYPGVAAVVRGAVAGANCASMMIVRKGDFDSDFLCYCFNSNVGRSQVAMVEYGAAQKQFNISHAVEFFFPVPPLEEQRNIAGFIKTETRKIDSTIAKIENEIDLLQEYGTALISEVVTGKLKVV